MRKQPRARLAEWLPEAIMTPLLSWSLRYVTCYAGDILAARAELDRL
ncbi:hypothetical protein [Novosphingobium sp. 17-62-19]|nr:hypothetical protein [Novosphingobium sp. 17-62-19]